MRIGNQPEGQLETLPEGSKRGSPSPRFERHQLWSVVGVGVVVSLLAFAVLSRQLEANHQLDFEWAAHNRANAIEQEIGTGLQALETLASVFAVALEVDQEQFSVLARSASEGGNGIRALAWLPPATSGATGARIEFVEPIAGNREFAELDATGTPSLRRLLTAAAGHDRALLSGPLPPEEGAWGRCSVLAARPVGRGGARGFVLALIDVGELAHGAISMLEPRGVEVLVRDTTDEQAAFLAAYASRLAPPSGLPCAPPATLPDPAHSATITLATGGRTWSVVTSATGRFRSAEAFDEGPWVILVGGLLITALFALSLVRLFERRRLQTQAMRSAHLVSLGVLAAGAAHEINNPNNAIQFNASVLSRALADAIPVLDRKYEEDGDFSIGGLPYSEARGALPRLGAEIVENSRRIKGITSNMKHLGRADDGDLSQRVDLPEALAAAVTMLKSRIANRTAHFEVDVADSVPPVTGNAQQLSQVLINLLLNALQALPDRSRGVRVRVDSEAGIVRVQVEDEGVGIDPSVRERLTEPFVTTRQGAGGMGLGLAISSSIIESHHGTLVFEESPSGGTLVTVKLPSVRAHGGAT